MSTPQAVSHQIHRTAMTVAVPQGAFAPQKTFSSCLLHAPICPPPQKKKIRCVKIRPNLTISAWKMANFCSPWLPFFHFFASLKCSLPSFPFPPPHKKKKKKKNLDVYGATDHWNSTQDMSYEWTHTLCKESHFQFPRIWGKYSATNIIAIHPTTIYPSDVKMFMWWMMAVYRNKSIIWFALSFWPMRATIRLSLEWIRQSNFSNFLTFSAKFTSLAAVLWLWRIRTSWSREAVISWLW